jgi:2-polyprenyl-3-methyl-5-hydroxy-6-metoxy-1,4-benzoquinol methylase
MGIDQNNQETRLYWDQQAASFDQEPDHGLKDPLVREAWSQLLEEWLPPNPVRILDIGCGTGSLSILLAGLGHQVTGIDLSPAMISQAKRKALQAGVQICFTVMDAANPTLPNQTYDGILCRHLLWSFPSPADALTRWVDLLVPGGHLLLIEGYWHTGSGLHSIDVLEALPPSLKKVNVQDLSDQPNFWGRKVDDERYAIMAELKA